MCNIIQNLEFGSPCTVLESGAVEWLRLRRALRPEAAPELGSDSSALRNTRCFAILDA